MAVCGVDGNDVRRRQICVLGRAIGFVAIDVEVDPIERIRPVELDIPPFERLGPASNPETLIEVIGTVGLGGYQPRERRRRPPCRGAALRLLSLIWHCLTLASTAATCSRRASVQCWPCLGSGKNLRSK